jgi:heme A synthase
VRQTYRVLAGLIALGVVVQAAAIAFGWFAAISDVDNGLVIDKNYEGNAGHALHGIVGFYVMPVLGLVFLIVSFVAAKAVPRGRTWAAIVFVAILVQVTLAFLAFGLPAIGALHGLNALVVFGTAVRAVMLTRIRTGVPAGEQVPAAGTSLPV